MLLNITAMENRVERLQKHYPDIEKGALRAVLVNHYASNLEVNQDDLNSFTDKLIANGVEFTRNQIAIAAESFAVPLSRFT